MCTGLAKLAVRNVQVVQRRNILSIGRPVINTVIPVFMPKNTGISVLKKRAVFR